MNMKKLYLFSIMKIYVSCMLCEIMHDYIYGDLVSMNYCDFMLVQSSTFFKSHCACISFSFGLPQEAFTLLVLWANYL
jgi:hypothetical protein